MVDGPDDSYQGGAGGGSLRGEAHGVAGDVDAHGLPPGVALPDAGVYRRDQLRARLVVSVVALALLGAITFMSERHRQVALYCTAGAAAATLVLAVRWGVACNTVRMTRKKVG